MKTRIITAAVIIPVALAILLIFPPIVLTVVLALVCAVAAYELFGAVNRTCAKTPSPRAAIYAMIGAFLIPFVVYLNNLINIPFYTGELAVFFILMCLMLVDFFLTLKSEKRLRLKQLLITPVAALIIPYMLSSLIGLRMQGAQHGMSTAAAANFGRWLVVLPVVVTVFTDSGAYFTGVLIGKHKPLPKISPNKTVEGFIGGIVIGAAALLCYGLVFEGAAGVMVNVPRLILYGVIGAVITEIGDLAFSLIKRKCKIKDYGNIFPGHGGVLDRFDSLIFTAPAMYALVALLPVVM